MRNGTRCPYCVEGGQFKVMVGQDPGDWFMCARCGHITMLENLHSHCTCSNCVVLDNSRGARK